MNKIAFNVFLLKINKYTCIICKGRGGGLSPPTHASEDYRQSNPSLYYFYCIVIVFPLSRRDQKSNFLTTTKKIVNFCFCSSCLNDLKTRKTRIRVRYIKKLQEKFYMVHVKPKPKIIYSKEKP